MITEQGGNLTVVERTVIGDYAQYRTETLNGAVQSGGWEFLHSDHLGSIESITDINGDVRERRGFDPFGKVRDLNEDDSNGGLLQSSATKRGFTGHEHLDGVELIHANGWAYDYNLGRFLSVDPFILMPENSQAYNPYSYVMNNPLRYTDPTGYMVKQNCSPVCDVDDIETRSKKESTKEARVEKRISNLLKESILLGNGSATKVGDDNSPSSGTNVGENSNPLKKTFTGTSYREFTKMQKEIVSSVLNASIKGVSDAIAGLSSGDDEWLDNFSYHFGRELREDGFEGLVSSKMGDLEKVLTTLNM